MTNLKARQAIKRFESSVRAIERNKYTLPPVSRIISKEFKEAKAALLMLFDNCNKDKQEVETKT